MPFLFLVTLTFVLDIQTRPTEGPNTSSFEFGAIHSAVPEIGYFTHKQKSHRQRQNRTLRSAVISLATSALHDYDLLSYYTFGPLCGRENSLSGVVVLSSTAQTTSTVHSSTVHGR